MSDTYQAIYDATRSRLCNGDIGSAVEQAMRDANISHYFEMAMHRVNEAASAYDNPSALFKPKLSLDGDQWCALYGDNLQDGVAGFGESPHLAMQAFDAAWYAKLPTVLKGERDE